MKKFLISYWKWYDKLEEPYRFATAMLMISPIFLVTLTNNNSFIITLIGIFLPISLIISRWIACK